MVMRLGLGKNNHLTYASLALNPRYDVMEHGCVCYILKHINITLQKHAYSNIMKILLPKKKKKNENFKIKNSDIFHISAQNIDCGN